MPPLKSIDSSLLKLEAKGSVNSVLGAQMSSHTDIYEENKNTKWYDTKKPLKEEEQEMTNHWLSKQFQSQELRCSISIWD